MRYLESSPLLMMLLAPLLSACSSEQAAAPIVHSSATPTSAAAIYNTVTPPAAMRSADVSATTGILISSGGGSGGGQDTDASAPPKVILPPVTLPPLPPPVIVDGAGAVTDIHYISTTGSEQTKVPVTFGQVFAPGDVGSAQTMVGKLADGSTVPLQLDVKARHADNSVRHALISTTLPKLKAGQFQRMILAKGTTTGSGPAVTIGALLGAGFNASVQINLDGARYTASADSLLRSGKPTTWMAGPVASEWLVSAPLVNAQGKPHPHLAARFAVRAYGTKQARVDVTVENNWAFEDHPQNFVYDADVVIDNRKVFSTNRLKHYHHARWRKVFWWGAEPGVHLAHNTRYLISTKAVPNYDQSIDFSDRRLAFWKDAWTGKKTELMGVGLANPFMHATGGRPDIGILPAWTVTYLLTMDKRVKDVTLGTADLAGSWSAHYRDRRTDQPVSVVDYPYMTIKGRHGDTKNPVTGKHESFPNCPPAKCSTASSHDASHQPSFAYVPYLLTGDHYYLEELQFWAAYNTFMSNPGYREHDKALFKNDQVRGQAWSLRSVAQAAYITPDNDRLKAHFDHVVKSNLAWYNAQYTNNRAANPFGALTEGKALVYRNKMALAPWMDDFFTSAVGHTAELGYPQAASLLKWKAKFPIGRMTAPGTCWVQAAMYAMILRDSEHSALYNSFGEAFRASSEKSVLGLPCASSAMWSALNLEPGEMDGYAKSVKGYPANMQPALAYAADAHRIEGGAAWNKFMSRPIKPDYSAGPQFAIVPR